VFYDFPGNVASVPPFAGYNSPDPQWQCDAPGNPLGLSGPGTGPVRMHKLSLKSNLIQEIH
jgi:hypothetical protein